jgi:hypothetical protein
VGIPIGVLGRALECCSYDSPSCTKGYCPDATNTLAYPATKHGANQSAREVVHSDDSPLSQGMGDSDMISRLSDVSKFHSIDIICSLLVSTAL